MMRVGTLALLIVGCHSATSTSTATAWGRANAWMRARDSPDADQQGMMDLKNSDPGAFAIVQALMAKQQMGLLDAAHLTSHHDEPKAADILRAAPAVDEAPEAPVAEIAVSAPVHQTMSHNPWTFKAKSGDDDDKMVANVLGAVAELKGGIPSKSFLSSPPVVEAPVARAPVAPSPHVASLTAEKAKTHYMDDINFAGMFSNSAAAAAAMGRKSSAPSSGNVLTSFSWNSDDKMAMRVKTNYIQAAKLDEASAKAIKKGALAAWFKQGDEEETATPAKPAAPAAPVQVAALDETPKDPNAIHDIDSYLNWAHSSTFN